MDAQLPRGMRDFPPEEKLVRDELISRLTIEFQRFGFLPLETPTLERLDVLNAKYAGGAEIVKEMFTLQDQGKRKLGLRYDLTVPLARFIAMNPNVKLPFKRYQIEKVYRDGPIKRGRYREFYQCDGDIIGADSALADAQCVQLALAGFDSLGIEVNLFVNSIELLKGLLTEDGVPAKKLTGAMLIIDKLRKIGVKEVKKELKGAGIPEECVANLVKCAQLKTNEERLNSLTERYPELPGLERMREILALIPDNRVVFDPSLSRGLSYYTGVVFEGFHEDLAFSLCGGGRYDTMIGSFLQKEDAYPAVGISFGLEPIMELFKSEKLQTKTQVFVIPIKTVEEASALAKKLRDAGINTDIDLLGRGISKNLDYANALGIPYVVILGKRELDQGTCTLKDMCSGEERQLSQDELVTVLNECE